SQGECQNLLRRTWVASRLASLDSYATAPDDAFVASLLKYPRAVEASTVIADTIGNLFAWRPTS
ncbi:MAG: hypothetical protein J5771_02870, partial [Bacteroidales bacterium]|nr:hypothetical protein [Bacteroidales bacterium]